MKLRSDFSTAKVVYRQFQQAVPGTKRDFFFFFFLGSSKIEIPLLRV